MIADNYPVILKESPFIYCYKVEAHDGTTYTFVAEYFKQDAGGFAFFIDKQKVAWFDYKIVKAIFIDNKEKL